MEDLLPIPHFIYKEAFFYMKRGIFKKIKCCTSFFLITEVQARILQNLDLNQ